MHYHDAYFGCSFQRPGGETLYHVFLQENCQNDDGYQRDHDYGAHLTPQYTAILSEGTKDNGQRGAEFIR